MSLRVVIYITTLKGEILGAAIIGILILSCGIIPLHNMPKGITFAEKTYYEKELVYYYVALLYDIGVS